MIALNEIQHIHLKWIFQCAHGTKFLNDDKKNICCRHKLEKNTLDSLIHKFQIIEVDSILLSTKRTRNTFYYDDVSRKIYLMRVEIRMSLLLFMLLLFFFPQCCLFCISFSFVFFSAMRLFTSLPDEFSIVFASRHHLFISKLFLPSFFCFSIFIMRTVLL